MVTMDSQRTIVRRRDFPGCGSSPGPPGPPGPRPPGPAGPGRLRGAFRSLAGGRAAGWRPVDGDPPTGRTLTRLRPLAGRSPLNCGPYAPLGRDASPGQGAPYGRGSSRSSSARLWLRSIAFLDLFLDVERLDRRARDRCLAPRPVVLGRHPGTGHVPVLSPGQPRCCPFCLSLIETRLVQIALKGTYEPMSSKADPARAVACVPPFPGPGGRRPRQRLPPLLTNIRGAVVPASPGR